MVLARREESGSRNQLYSSLSRVTSLVILEFEATRSSRSTFTLSATWGGVPSISLKILLLRSNHSFQQRIFGTHIQHCFSNFNLEKEKGAISGQEANKEVTEGGRGKFN